MKPESKKPVQLPLNRLFYDLTSSNTETLISVGAKPTRPLNGVTASAMAK